MNFIVLSFNEDDENVQILNENVFRILKYFLIYFSRLSKIKFLAYSEHTNDFQAHGFM